MSESVLLILQEQRLASRFLNTSTHSRVGVLS
jgi:hypothetical protein